MQWAHQITSLFVSDTKGSQDGGTGRYTLPPHTTKRRTTTNLKTKTNQNCQNIKLYGSLTAKELKKKHSLRPVDGVEKGICGERMHGKVSAGGPGRGGSRWWTGCPTFACR